MYTEHLGSPRPHEAIAYAPSLTLLIGTEREREKSYINTVIKTLSVCIYSISKEKTQVSAFAGHCETVMKCDLY